ncbi:MAG: alkaline phosphatase D [Polaribacter sp.]|jgi:alkaline phosphatase D
MTLHKQLLAFLFLLCLFSCDQKKSTTTVSESDISQYYDADKQPFYHGVASGDPLPDRVIIWTRLTPSQKGESFPVKWIIAKDEALTEVVNEGIVTAYANRDFTIKIDVLALEADQFYYYQFIEKGKKSALGRTKTAPKRAANKVKLAVISCTNYEAGYYNALANLAKQDSLDAIIHLGDYIYEYEPGGYGNEDLDRHHLPAKELLTLEDYRIRYSQYRLDLDFQEVHKLHPFIAIWDDHEIANNAYTTGAKNHQPDEGDYIKRRQAAQQAYYEWLPIRENAGGQLYRKITMGKLVDILLLDERVAGRSAPVEKTSDKNYNSDERSMLGEQQYQWLTKSLSSSEAHWKIIGNQVIFSDFDYTKVRPEKPTNMDAWDGYPAEKKKLIEFVQERQVDNLVFVSGDTHCSWAFEVPSSADAYRKNPTKETIAIELGTPSVTSSNYDEYESTSKVKKAEEIYKKENLHLKYVDLRNHGYLLLEITEGAILATYNYVETLEKPSSVENRAGLIRIESGTKKLTFGH